MTARILVCGGRNYSNREKLDAVLNAIVLPHAVIISGGASGADDLAARWAIARGVQTQIFKADWNRHGRGAGSIRNQQMLDEGKPNLVIAFPGGRGTADMIARAKAAGVYVSEVAE